jgi:hypothetical protein
LMHDANMKIVQKHVYDCSKLAFIYKYNTAGSTNKETQTNGKLNGHTS